MQNEMEKNLLKKIAGISGFSLGSAFNLRANGVGVERHSTDQVKIVSKVDKPGIDIYVKANSKREQVHIPVIVTDTGVNDLVYNDFYIGEGAQVEIIAGCGIHNDGCNPSQHDGIHTFHIRKNANVIYSEKHYGEGNGSGERILNPTTIVYMEENAVCQMDTVQIKGVDSTVRTTDSSPHCQTPLRPKQTAGFLPLFLSLQHADHDWLGRYAGIWHQRQAGICNGRRSACGRYVVSF